MKTLKNLFFVFVVAILVSPLVSFAQNAVVVNTPGEPVVATVTPLIDGITESSPILKVGTYKAPFGADIVVESIEGQKIVGTFRTPIRYKGCVGIDPFFGVVRNNGSVFMKTEAVHGCVRVFEIKLVDGQLGWTVIKGPYKQGFLGILKMVN